MGGKKVCLYTSDHLTYFVNCSGLSIDANSDWVTEDKFVFNFPENINFASLKTLSGCHL